MLAGCRRTAGDAMPRDHCGTATRSDHARSTRHCVDVSDDVCDEERRERMGMGWGHAGKKTLYCHYDSNRWSLCRRRLCR